jgi:uncharacterized membrane protein YccC
MQDAKRAARFSRRDFVHAIEMPIACLIAYWIITYGLARFVDPSTDILGGMWTVIATIFVFRETGSASLAAGMSRLIATCVSFALCLPYLLLFPSNPGTMALLLAFGTIVMTLLGRRDDIITTAITTAVVMVVAAISPQEAWRQPLLRLVDTVVGVGVGVCCRWIAALLSSKLVGEPAQ